MDIKKIISKTAKDIFPEIVKLRREIHKNPELSFQEFNTVRLIKSIFDKYNIDYDESFGENALIGIIEGKNKGKTVGLRADLDALAIFEKNNVDYKSVNDGVMHACGHDVHTASLVGTAIILSKITEHITGTIILIFQPGEELDPGGAKILIDKGLLEKYKLDCILGQHVLPHLETGMFGFTPGKAMAATNEIYVDFNGKGGHAAMPQQRSDTVLAAANFITMAEKLPEKHSNSEEPVVVAFGRIIADGAINIIPSSSHIHGTMRTFNEGVRTTIQKELQEIADISAQRYGCTAQLEIKDGYPHLSNDEKLTKAAINIAEKFIGKQNVVLAEKRMTAEDFSYFAQKVPAVYYRMGILGNNKGNISLHNENFDVDENALEYSSSLMSFLAV